MLNEQKLIIKEKEMQYLEKCEEATELELQLKSLSERFVLLEKDILKKDIQQKNVENQMKELKN